MISRGGHVYCDGHERAKNLQPGPAHSQPVLRRALASRHVSMISIGGIIGAGLFVGSSAAIAAVGPAIVISYLLAGAIILLVMRMLCEMAVALPVRAFRVHAPLGPAPARRRLAVLGISGSSSCW
jgi:amino acid permease